ncbi:CLUMA_CG010397, isoform A [Clunio marinus]|uniref:CLUMA_CG010397, isoform A n=1 Tax=Clunio marinus TaxID=568069 RepID=A0A1J1I9U7_9DIPT|nr:CLUMA_CG010397, isoform A [Clunio marinus]
MFPEFMIEHNVNLDIAEAIILGPRKVTPVSRKQNKNFSLTPQKQSFSALWKEMPNLALTQTGNIIKLSKHRVMRQVCSKVCAFAYTIRFKSRLRMNMEKLSIYSNACFLYYLPENTKSSDIS